MLCKHISTPKGWRIIALRSLWRPRGPESPQISTPKVVADSTNRSALNWLEPLVSSYGVGASGRRYRSSLIERTIAFISANLAPTSGPLAIPMQFSIAPIGPEYA